MAETPFLKIMYPVVSWLKKINNKRIKKKNNGGLGQRKRNELSEKMDKKSVMSKGKRVSVRTKYWEKTVNARGG